MRFEVNLATRPFVNHAPHLILLSLLLLVAVGLTTWNLALFLSTKSETRAVQAQLAAIEQEEERLQSSRRELTARLADVEIEELRAEVKAANTVLSERAVRWSELLARLQDLMPYKAALQSISTSVDRTGIRMSLEVRTPDQEYFLRTMELLQASPCFSSVYPSSADHRGGELVASIDAIYEPECGEETKQAAAPAAAGGSRG